MLPVKNLDDLYFKDMVEEAKKLIPGFTDEWSNRSSSDPGITFIELFAWLQEMQQYYLNEISEKNKQKYLKLLGEKMEHDVPSKAIVTISGIEKSFELPLRCKFSANDIIFETYKQESVYNLKISNFYTMEKDTVIGKSDENWNNHYLIFGNNPKENNAFYICFHKPFPINKDVDITVNIYDEYKIKRNPIKDDDKFYSLGEIQWEYYCKGQWKNIEQIKDSTHEFINSGTITVNIKDKMCFHEESNGYVIRAVLKKSYYEVAPVLKYINSDSVKLIQKDTAAQVIDLNIINEKEEIKLPNYLGQTGDIEAFVKRNDNFLERTDKYDITYKDEERYILFDKLNFTDYMENNAVNIVLCTYDNNFYSKKNIGFSSGFPNFTVDLNLNHICYEDFEIWISKDDEGIIFEKWEKTEDLLLEDCKAKKYYLDIEQSKIIFGDGINGKIPDGEIIITSCSFTLANEGNVKKGEINKMLYKNSNVFLVNYEHAYGGRKAQLIEDKFKMIRKNINKVTKAVTDKDYEYIVKTTPGLMIKSAKVIIPEENNHIFTNDNPNSIYIVAEAYSEDYEKKEALNEAYIKNIKNNLDKYRLITTEIEVIPPEYVAIEIEAEIQADSYYKDAEGIIKETINNYFYNEKWEFGCGVTYSDVYGIIDTLECVRHIYSLNINFNGKGAKRTSSGDINIPQNGMIYLKNCEISVSND